MQIDITTAGMGEAGVIILIVIMALVTLITRLGGVFLMAHIALIIA